MRYLILVVVHAVLFSSLACAAPTVFLKDGTQVTGNSVWTENNKVYLSDSNVIREYGQDEVKLDETVRFNRIGSQIATPDDSPSAPAGTGKAQRAKRSHAGLSAVRTEQPAAEAPEAPKATPPAVVSPAAKPASASAPAAATENVVKPLPKPDTPPAPTAAPPAPTPMPTAQEPTPAPAAPAIPPAPQMMSSGFPVMFLLIVLALSLLIVASYWIIYERAGQAGWKSLIPFYNMYVLMEISGKPGWWMFLLFVPLVGVVVYLLAMLSLAKRFGRSELFGVGIFLLPMIFLPLLAFGGAKYQG